MTAFEAYDASADLLNVLRADQAGQRLAARLPTSRERLAADPGGPGDQPHPQATTDPTAWATVLDAMVRAGLHTRLLHGGGVFTTADPQGLSQALEASPRFRRDTRLGSVFHHTKISFREVAPTASLHVVIDGNTVSSHIDRVSPLNLDPDHRAHYSPIRVLAHNATGIVDDMVSRFGGRRGERRPARRDRPAGLSPASTLDDSGPTGSPDPANLAQTTVPFSVIDEAVHLLDTEAAPWSIQLEARVGGSLDEARLRAAIIEALGRHPMARARKKPSRRVLHHDSWEIPTHVDIDPLRVVDCPDDEALRRARVQLQSLAIPLAESPPLRVRLARHGDGDILMLNVNHAAMDGLGALRVLRSIARAYAGDVDPVPPFDIGGIRDLPVWLAATNPATRLRRQLVLIEKLRDLITPPARVAADSANGNTGYGFHHVALSRAATEVLVERQHRGTVNDLLVAALHRSIAQWNVDHGGPDGGRIAVLAPANLRPVEHRHELVGNFSLPARVTTNRRHRRDASATLAAVTAQTSRKKKTGMGTALIEVLGRSRTLPLWAKQALVTLLPATGDRMVDTAMVSNLGVLEDVPSFGPDAGEVTSVWFSPPARMPMGLTVGAVTVSGRLHLSFRYRQRLFGPAAAQRFACLFLDELEGTTPRELPSASPGAARARRASGGLEKEIA